MQKELEQVYKFNEIGGQDLATYPRTLTDSAFKSQFLLIAEEVEETVQAFKKGNYVEVLDGMIDTAYVLFGLVNKLGMQKEFIEGFQRVHENNMTKVQDSEGNIIVKFNENGKITKPEGYKPIDLGEHFPNIKELNY